MVIDFKDWWTNLWLNEGFSNWIGYYCVNKIFHDHNIWVRFAGKELTLALGRDAFPSSHSVEVCQDIAWNKCWKSSLVGHI